jgi:hypothetical protein
LRRTLVRFVCYSAKEPHPLILLRMEKEAKQKDKHLAIELTHHRYNSIVHCTTTLQILNLTAIINTLTCHPDGGVI